MSVHDWALPSFHHDVKLGVYPIDLGGGLTQDDGQCGEKI